MDQKKAVFISLPCTIALLLVTSVPALAHHPLDGRTPGSFLEGFLSGLAHPLIGPDHFTFVVAIGLLAAIQRQGLLILIAFILSAMLGTGLHLVGLNLPGAELLIAGSILLFGLLLSLKESPNTLLVTALAAIAGVFHGYAYGESIFGATLVPLLAYLIGFTVIQMVISMGVFAIAKGLMRQNGAQTGLSSIRSAGLVICGMGVAFLSAQLMSAVLPS
jgi:urease accessory protein